VRRASAYRQRLAWYSALAMAAYTALALAAGNQPLEYLDEETGATVTVVGQPLVFVYTHPQGANIRDYVTLAAAAVNRSGKVDYLLIGYFWSTLDPRLRPGGLPAVEPLVLQADERRIELTRGHSAREAGIGVPVHRPSFATAAPEVYAVELPTLRFIGESRQLALHIESAATPVEYSLFDDRRSALKAFVRQVDGGG
jgi:hypothetical protein